MNNEQDNDTETVFVSKYDVLLNENSEGELEFWLPFSSDDSLNDCHRAADQVPLPQQQLQRQQSQPHVGNNRFSILCKMYLTEFRMADTEQQQTAVLQKLHDMISQQCIDSACARAGKFLLRQEEHAQSSRSSGWVELTREQAFSFIRSSLELEQVKSAAGLLDVPPSSSQATPEDDKKRRRRSSLLRRSLSGGAAMMAGSDQKKRIAQRQSIRPSIRQSTIHLAQFLEGVDFDSDVDDNDKGNHAEPTMMTMDAPQNSSSSPVMMLQRSGSWSANNGDKQHVVQTANALDVILRIDPSTLSYSLVPNHTGNNRIGVMIQMQTSKYVALRESQGTAISVCRDLVDMVKDNYCGKFLVQVNNGQDDDYRCLTDEQAISALDSVFSTAAGIGQKPAPPAVAAVYNNSNKQDETLSQVNPIPISFAWGGSVGSGGDAHKTAREELQRRKKRQGFNTKISQLVAKTSLERSQSVGSSGSIPIPIALPLPSPTRISKFSTTGGLTERTTAANHSVDGSRPYSASLPVSMPSATINDLLEQQDETDDIGEPLDVEPLSPEALRRPTLSAFSRAMIQDMLTRLDVVNDEEDLGNGV